MCHEPERSIQSFEHGLALSHGPQTWNILERHGIRLFLFWVNTTKGEFAEKSVELAADVHSLPALKSPTNLQAAGLRMLASGAVQLMSIHQSFRTSHSHHLFPVRSPEFPPALERYTARSRDIGMSEQRLAAIVSADVAVYSRLMGRDERGHAGGAESRPAGGD